LYQCGSVQAHLYCLEVARDVAVSQPNATGRYAFTGSPFNPANGLDGGDGLCNAQAASASLPGTYRVLLATSTASAASRFNLDGGIWVRPDHVPIVAAASDLASDKLVAPISTDATGRHFDGAGQWAGAWSIGAAGDGGSTCSDWTVNDAGYGSGGTSGTLRSPLPLYPMFGPSTFACSSGYTAIYCLQE
jgi:hypothetical protein